MDPNKVRVDLLAYEAAMPHAEELAGVYQRLGYIASETSVDFSYAEDTLAEKLISICPAFDEGGELFAPVVEALSAKDQEQDKALEAGLAIAEYIKRSSSSTRKQLTGYLQACFQVDRLKLGLTGTYSNMVAENSILFYARQSIVEGLDPSFQTYRIIDNISDTLQDIHEKDDWFGWFIPKAFMLLQEIGLRYNAHRVLDQFRPANESSISDYGGVLALHNDVKEFVSGTMRNRKYGVKAAYIPASIGGSWVFYDAEDFKEMFANDKHASELFPDAAAVIFYSGKEEFHDLTLTREEIDLGNGTLVRPRGGIETLMSKLRLVLSHEGDLYLDFSQFMPLEKEIRDEPGLYEAILAEVVANFHDLTVPVGSINIVRQPNITQLTGKQRKNFDPILQLLVPRLKKRYIGDQDEKNLRSVRLHDVTWFVRSLTEGFKTSPAAVERARTHGIVLGLGETFVRSHQRGKDNDVKGHIVKKH